MPSQLQWLGVRSGHSKRPIKTEASRSQPASTTGQWASLAMLNGSSALGSAHNDVLEAMPETEESQIALVEEIKSRAKGVFAAGNYPEAEKLYDKAISLRPDAVLHANRSAVRLHLNFKDGALKDADEAVKLDPAYPKGYYRKGQVHNALKEYTQARQAFEKGLELEPQNKIFLSLATKAKELEQAERQKSEPTPMAVDASSPRSSEPSKSAKEGEKPPASGGAAKTSKTKSGKKEDDEEDVRGENLRGYKTLADGRKTTYFNSELSEEAKKLIGDIAPKKIEVKQEEEGADKKGAGSAWNYAGTFEAKDMTEWAKNRLKELLGGANFVTPGTGAIIDVVKVKDVDGDASITFVRGKKKYLFDFVFSLDWEMELDSGRAKGTLKYPDVTPDNDGEYDTLLEVDPLTPPSARGVIDRYIKSSDDGLQRIVKEKLDQFMADYKQF